MMVDVSSLQATNVQLRSRPQQLPMRVAVLIDHRPNSPQEVGGLAGTWEQIAQVACGRSDVDLTLFFLGEATAVRPWAQNVRVVLLPPMLGTERFAFFRDIPTHTDLAPFHPWLFWHLRGFQILHTTDTFYAFAKTARWRARLSGIPLITSVQTDLIGWTRIYAPTFLRRLLHSRVLVRWLLETQHYLDREERFMENRFRNYLQTCQAVLVSHERDWKRVQRLVPDLPLFFLRRGIDLEAFHPRLRARQQVEQRFGIPPGRVLLLFVGRLDPVKGALIAAEVVHRLAHQGKNVYLLVVGEGAQRQEIAQVLGDRGTCTGNLPHAELGSIYASADLLLFPSESEVWPNVVIEARACGLPVIACTQGAGHIMKGEGWDGILVPDRHPETWLSVVEALLDRPTTLQEMGRRARQAIEESVPTWSQVLEEDLLPVWRAVARDTSAELRQVWPKLGKISLRRLLHR